MNEKGVILSNSMSDTVIDITFFGTTELPLITVITADSMPKFQVAAMNQKYM
jgi:translation initiation factor 2B subunit (eIF-2B alpha/beta/delta family)